MENQFREKFAKMMASVKESDILDSSGHIIGKRRDYSFFENGKGFLLSEGGTLVADNSDGFAFVYFDDETVYCEYSISKTTIEKLFRLFLQWANGEITITILRNGNNNAD